MPHRPHAIALAAYLVVTLALTWPLPVQLGTSVPFDNGDPLLSIWNLWWNARHQPFSARWWDGDIFAPAPDALSFSDHRVGLGLLASPVIWSGGSPLTAYNVAFLASFVLSGWSMYALAFTLTGRRDAAWLAGLVFAFHPFRSEHLPHLELLSSYWLPLALLALHRWADAPDARPRWLVAASVALTMQALTCGYYFVFSYVLLATWAVWFVPPGLTLRHYTGAAAAVAAPIVVLAPVLAHYRSAHTSLGLSRSITEIEQLSADIAALATAPDPLRFWGWLRAWPAVEGALFPGLTAVLLVVAAGIAYRRSQRPPSSHGSAWPLWRRVCVVLAAVAGIVAAMAAVGRPIDLTLGSVRVSAQQAYKPLTVAGLGVLLAAVGSPLARRLWRARSPGAYYAGATLVCWAFALGPTARLLGARVFYKAPYAWLMALPGFADEFRAPSRFAMLAALSLAAAAALAFVRLTSLATAGWRKTGVALATVGILVDGWIQPFPLAIPPAKAELPPGIPSDALVLELPLGVYEDAAAMYRATSHEHRIVNGLSGYDPPSTAVLRAALSDGHVEVLDALAPDSPLALVLHAAAPETWLSTIPSRTAARSLSRVGADHVLLRPRMPKPAWTDPSDDRPVEVTEIWANDNPVSVALAIDGRAETTWSTTAAQRGGETVRVTLANEATVSGLRLTLGRYAWAFPRSLTVYLSRDGKEWHPVFDGPLAVPAITSAQADPRLLRVHVPFPASSARFVQLVQTGASGTAPWVVAELTVLHGTPGMTSRQATSTTASAGNPASVRRDTVTPLNGATSRSFHSRRPRGTRQTRARASGLPGDAGRAPVCDRPCVPVARPGRADHKWAARRQDPAGARSASTWPRRARPPAAHTA